MIDYDQNFKHEDGLYYLYVITKKCKKLSDQKYYVGVSHDPERRWMQHAKSKGDSYITKAIAAHGIEKFSFRVIEGSKDHSYIMRLEQYWVYKLVLDNFKLYNRGPGGGGKMFASAEERKNKSLSAFKMRPEVKRERARKSAEARSKIVLTLEQRLSYAESKMGDKNPMYGKKRTDEEKEMFRQKSIDAYTKRKSGEVISEEYSVPPTEVLCFYKYYSHENFIREDVSKMTGFSTSNVKKIKNRYTHKYITDEQIDKYYTDNKNILDLKVKELSNKDKVYVISNKGDSPRGKDQELTEDQVREIRDKYKNKKGTFRSLAKEYNVGKTTVEQIVTFKKWKDVV